MFLLIVEPAESEWPRHCNMTSDCKPGEKCISVGLLPFKVCYLPKGLPGKLYWLCFHCLVTQIFCINFDLFVFILTFYKILEPKPQPKPAPKPCSDCKPGEGCDFDPLFPLFGVCVPLGPYPEPGKLSRLCIFQYIFII